MTANVAPINVLVWLRSLQFTGEKFEVLNAQMYAGFVVHSGSLSGAGSIKVGQTVSMHVDYDRRSFVAPNHTMTHVLNYALRSVLVLGEIAGISG